jgi:hypothetical protein
MNGAQYRGDVERLQGGGCATPGARGDAIRDSRGSERVGLQGRLGGNEKEP